MKRHRSQEKPNRYQAFTEVLVNKESLSELPPFLPLILSDPEY